MMRYLVFISVFMLAFASVSAGMANPVFVTGKVYNSDYSATIAGAEVEANCNGVIGTDTSAANGDYLIDISDQACKVGDTVVVKATKDGATGTASDTVKTFNFIDLAVVNVAIPEFTTIAALAALAGGAAILYRTRKK